MTADRRRPRVFIKQDVVFGDTLLSRIVEQAGCELQPSIESSASSDALDEDPVPLALIIVSLDPDPMRTIAWVADLRRRDWLAAVPILGVSSLDRLGIDYRRLREVGLTGLIDAGAPREHVRFRVSQLAYRGREGRRFERAPCCIPVELETGGERTTAYATSLSAGGMGLACSHRIEPNTVLGLRFALDEETEPISVSGRIVRLQESRRPDAAYEIGVFFHRLSRPVHDEISATVSRLLAAWDTVSAAGLIGRSAVDSFGADGPGGSPVREGQPGPESLRSLDGALRSESWRGAPRGPKRAWERRVVVLAGIAIAAFAVAPLTVRYTKDHRRAQALSDSRMLGRAILAFYLDVGRWPVNNDEQLSSGEISRLVGLPASAISPATVPKGRGSAGGWAGAGDGGSAGAIEDHLIRNAREGLSPIYPTSSTAPDPPGWNGPYLRGVPLDPWGRPYVCDTRYLSGAGISGVTEAETSDHAVLCLSAGPDRAFQTPFSDDEELSGPRGDDVGWMIQADETS